MAAAFNRWQIGGVRITQVVESGPTPTSPRFFFTDPPADLVQRHGWLKPHFATDEGRLLLQTSGATTGLVLEQTDSLALPVGWRPASLAADGSVDPALGTNIFADLD